MSGVVNGPDCWRGNVRAPCRPGSVWKPGSQPVCLIQIPAAGLHGSWPWKSQALPGIAFIPGGIREDTGFLLHTGRSGSFPLPRYTLQPG